MINFIKYQSWTFGLAVAITLISLGLLAVIGLRPAIDFTGGTLLVLNFTGERPTAMDMSGVIKGLNLNLGEPTAKPSGETNMMVRVRFLSEEEHNQLLTGIRTAYETPGDSNDLVLEERVETIGPSISANFRTRTTYAIIVVVTAILIYIAYAFRQISRPVQSWKYGIAAVLALTHDVLITIGVFTLLGKYLNVEVGVPFVVALLTILGYSVNDTIVVFDRIRENLIKKGSSEDYPTIVNLALNQTLARSFNTSFTTLLALFGLFFFGGESIKYFSLALIIGIAAGTYSSIFIASPGVVLWYRWKTR